MVQPKKGASSPHHQAPSSTNQYLLLAVKILLILVILLLLPQFVFGKIDLGIGGGGDPGNNRHPIATTKTNNNNNNNDYYYDYPKRIKRKPHSFSRSEKYIHHSRVWCETIDPSCAKLIPEESMNCIHKCVSPTCYESVYTIPLEPGEIDMNRAQAFEECITLELKEERRRNRQGGKSSVGTSSTKTAFT